MTLIPSLNGAHLRTYHAIFQHPIAHNLKWKDVYAMFGELGEVAHEHNGNVKVTREGEDLILHPHPTKDVAASDEIVAMRHFLERSDGKAAETEAALVHLLLVIDHHEARIFHCEMRDAVPQRVVPHEPKEYFRHARDSKETARGKEKPDANSYFEVVAQALKAAGRILIFGTGTGASSEMDQFIDWAKLRHPEVAKRIIGSLAVDVHHLTEGQLLEKAREFYAHASES